MQIRCDEGVANPNGPEPCIAEVRDEASARERTGRPLGRGRNIPGVAAGPIAEDNMDGRVIASVRATRRGQTSWHVPTPLRAPRPQAALVAECFTPRLRYSGCPIGDQLATMTAGGPVPLIAAAPLTWTGSGYATAGYIAACATVSIIATGLMPDDTNQDISQERA